MTANDRAEIRQMLTDVLSGHTNQVNGKFDVIQATLDAIEKQTTKTNGRVTTLESEVDTLKLLDVKHVSNCPYSARVRSLEDNEMSRKAVVKFIILGSAIAGSIAGLIVSLFKLF